MMFLDICEEHDLSKYFYIAPGVVGVGCTKCPYWEVYDQSNNPPVEITVYDDMGNIVEHRII